MSVKLTIAISDDVLRALRSGKSLTLNLATERESGQVRGRIRSRGAHSPRPGSLPARIIDWAGKRGKTFRTADVVRKFKLSRAHASMLLSRLAGGGYPIEREGRGVYSHT